MPRSSRLAICCLALLLCISLYVKGRVPVGKGEGAAFLRPAPGMIKVRLAGAFPRPGLYLFPDGATIRSAIKMTAPDGVPEKLPPEVMGRRLENGAVLTLTPSGPQPAVLALGKMPVKERMLLRIPLDPDRLDASEWAALPGIGPVLSERIVEDRHNNGAFGSVDALVRVPGVGAGKVAAIKRYF